MKRILQKIRYAFLANVISMVVSVITTLVVPKFFGNDIDQFGYYQIFIFYVGYIGFFHFGWCDGLYLRDGGKSYSKLNKNLYSIQFRLLILLEILLAIVLVLYSRYFKGNDEISFIIVMIAINLMLVIPQTMLSYIFQTTNRIREYSFITIISRVAYGIILVVIFMFGYKDYRLIVVGYNLSFLFSLLLCMYYSRDIIFAIPLHIRDGISEAIINIRVGSKLMISNVASLLITGIVRWGIQLGWSVEVYGKISLALSMTNIVLVLINAVSLVMYPTLKQESESRLISVYKIINKILMVILLGVLTLYYPMKILLSLWLPQYSESLSYMALLFPLCVYSTKRNILVTTYMKVFRYEKVIMLINLFCVVIALITTGISVFIFHNLELAILSIVFNEILCSVLSELALGKMIKNEVVKEIIFEFLMIIAFIFCNRILGGASGMSIYILLYLGYILLNKESIYSGLKKIKR